jgi:catechol 2,3-dioxygenase-like lactoylglutathione lyase family enzyme
MPKRRDPRPPVAIGHVSIAVRDVATTARWFAALGLREIAEGADYAVLELRGGTHLIVERTARRIRPGNEFPLRPQYDDIDEARHRCRRLGFAYRACADCHPPPSPSPAPRVTASPSLARGRRPV